MNAYERLPDTELEAMLARLAARGRPDGLDTAIMTAVDTTPQQRGPWFGRFARLLTPAPGLRPAWLIAILALLLALVAGTLAVGSRLLESSEPLPARLPALMGVIDTEEVAPGLSRVVNDGIRDLTSVDAVDVVAGYDGGIWLLRSDEILRVGSDGAYKWPMPSGPADHVFEVAPDGTMWIIPPLPHGYAFRSADGTEWTRQPCPEGCDGVTLAPDGTLWALWREGYRLTTGRLGATGWEPVAGDAPGDVAYDPLYGTEIDGLRFTDAGDLYAVSESSRSLYSYRDGRWHPLAGLYGDGGPLGVGPDGTVWLRSTDGGYLGETPPPAWEGAGLVRLADGEPRLWSPDDLPELGAASQFAGQSLKVAPDGSAWIDTGILEVDPETCDGLVRFDGLRLDRFLPGQCTSMDIAADGSVWFVAGDDGARDLYVIDPDAAMTAR